MSKSQIFYTDKYKAIEKAIVKLLNAQPDFLSAQTAASTRAVGDAIQTILSDLTSVERLARFYQDDLCTGQKFITDCSPSRWT